MALGMLIESTNALNPVLTIRCRLRRLVRYAIAQAGYQVTMVGSKHSGEMENNVRGTRQCLPPNSVLFGGDPRASMLTASVIGS